MPAAVRHHPSFIHPETAAIYDGKTDIVSLVAVPRTLLAGEGQGRTLGDIVKPALPAMLYEPVRVRGSRLST
jgi:hypothetical protein